MLTSNPRRKTRRARGSAAVDGEVHWTQSNVEDMLGREPKPLVRLRRGPGVTRSSCQGCGWPPSMKNDEAQEPQTRRAWCIAEAAGVANAQNSDGRTQAMDVEERTRVSRCVALRSAKTPWR